MIVSKVQKLGNSQHLSKQLPDLVDIAVGNDIEEVLDLIDACI